MTFALHLMVADADRAAAWYVEALGAEEADRVVLPDGRTFVVNLRLAGIQLAVAGAGRSVASAAGAAYHLSVPDAEAAFERAVAAGATVHQPLQDAFWGERTGQFVDPDGHRWAVDQRLRDVPADEIARQAAALFAGH